MMSRKIFIAHIILLFFKYALHGEKFICKLYFFYNQIYYFQIIARTLII